MQSQAALGEEAVRKVLRPYTVQIAKAATGVAHTFALPTLEGVTVALPMNTIAAQCPCVGKSIQISFLEKWAPQPNKKPKLVLLF